VEVHFKPELQAKLDQMARDTERASDELVEDALIGYFDELAEAREMLDGRYDDLESGKVKLIDGEAFFENLRNLTAGSA
jgi:predicted transcriptional regulator